MSAHPFEQLDFARAVQTGRVLEGRADLAMLPRLAAAVQGLVGDVQFTVSFGQRAFLGGVMHIQARAEVVLQCQRTLENFSQWLEVDRQLAPVRDEEDEARLPDEVEPMLLDEDGTLHPLACVEDELLLALPEIPRKPGSEDAILPWQEDAAAGGPFADLARLRRN